jgi:hypothetical protein
MAITTRFGQPLNSNVLSWSQFRDTLAVVVVKDHALSFDLGARDCPFGQLAPWHQNVGGVTFEDKLLNFRQTPLKLPHNLEPAAPQSSSSTPTAA